MCILTSVQTNPASPGVPTREVCERTGLHYSTISRMVKDGRLTPTFRVAEGQGGAMFFAEADVAQLAATLKAAS